MAGSDWPKISTFPYDALATLLDLDRLLSLRVASTSSSVLGVLGIQCNSNTHGKISPQCTRTKASFRSMPPNIVDIPSQSSLRRPSPKRPPGTPSAVDRLK